MHFVNPRFFHLLHFFIPHPSPCTSLTRTSRNQKGFNHKGNKGTQSNPLKTFVILCDPLWFKNSCFLYKDLTSKFLEHQRVDLVDHRAVRSQVRFGEAVERCIHKIVHFSQGRLGGIQIKQTREHPAILLSFFHHT